MNRQRNTQTISAPQAPQVEQDIRVQMLNSFMSCPHRDTDVIRKIHEDLQKRDPSFYSHLAAWYEKNGELRDHKEVFTSMLIVDPYLDNREVGLALWQKAVPFMKTRILGFIKGKKVKIREKTNQTRQVGKKKIPVVNVTEKVVGLFKNVPSAFKTEVVRYLKWLETDPERFDGVAMRNSEDLRTLYASLKIPHSKRVQQILWEKKYPKDSRLNVFKDITDAKSPEEAATLIVKNKVPYTTAVGLIEKMTPSILVALINSMSAQEVINNIASLQENGALDNPDTKAIVEKKLKQAEISKNVTALKSKAAINTGRIKDEAVIAQLDKIADVQIKSKGVIKIPTAIFVDRSGSMSIAIEAGKHCAAMVSGATEASLYVVAFDTLPMEIYPVSARPKDRTTTLTDWEKAFKPVRDGGSTSMGCALEYLRQKKMYVEQVVVITDEGENAGPMFTDVYPRYSEEMKVKPHVVIIRTPGSGQTFSANLKKAGISFDVYTPNGSDYYGLPGLIPLLARASKLDLLMEIMDTPLPARKQWK